MKILYTAQTSFQEHRVMVPFKLLCAKRHLSKYSRFDSGLGSRTVMPTPTLLSLQKKNHKSISIGNQRFLSQVVNNQSRSLHEAGFALKSLCCHHPNSINKDKEKLKVIFSNDIQPLQPQKHNLY